MNAKLLESLNVLHICLLNRNDIKDICIQPLCDSKSKSKTLNARIGPDYFDVRFYFKLVKKQLVLFSETRICTIYPGNVKAVSRLAKAIAKEERDKTSGFIFEPICCAGKNRITQRDVDHGRFNIGRVEFCFSFAIKEYLTEQIVDSAIRFINDQLYKYYSYFINESMKGYSDGTPFQNEGDRTRKFLRIYFDEATKLPINDKTTKEKIEILREDTRKNNDIKNAVCNFVEESLDFDESRLYRISAASSMNIKIPILDIVENCIEYERGELIFHRNETERRKLKEFFKILISNNLIDLS